MRNIVLSTLLALSFSTSFSYAQSAWTGGDDLPTNPLACDATPATAAAKPYDGGQPTHPKDLKGKNLNQFREPWSFRIGQS